MFTHTYIRKYGSSKHIEYSRIPVDNITGGVKGPQRTDYEEYD